MSTFDFEIACEFQTFAYQSLNGPYVHDPTKKPAKNIEVAIESRRLLSQTKFH